MMGFVGPGSWSLRLGYLGLALLALVLDQLTKFWILTNYEPLESTPVIEGFFDIAYHRNTGGAFGLLQGLPAGPREAVFIFIPTLIVAVIVVWSLRLPAGDVLPQLALASILGGALGNLVDRARYGFVVDFLYFRLGDTGWHWPAFNVADSFITCGVGFLLVYLFIEERAGAAG